MQVLSKGPDGFVTYVETSPEGAGSHGTPLDVHFVSMDYRDGRMNLVVLGETKQLRSLLQRMAADGMDYTVVEVSDASFEPNPALSALTARQRRVLVSAFRAGYYDVPRRVNSQELAVTLDLDKSTVVEHLRKAERRMLSRLIGGSESEVDDLRSPGRDRSEGL